jgi:hypothetical protein
MIYTFKNMLFNDKVYAYSDPIDPVYGSAEKCRVCGGFTSSLEWIGEKYVKFSKKTVGDFTFGSCFPFLLSERAFLLIRDSVKGILGFREVHDKTNRRFYCPKIETCVARIDEEKSGFIRAKSDLAVCSSCGIGATIKHYDKIVIDEIQMQDICILGNLPGTTLFNENLLQLVRDNKLTNVEEIEITKYKCPWGQ